MINSDPNATAATGVAIDKIYREGLILNHSDPQL